MRGVGRKVFERRFTAADRLDVHHPVLPPDGSGNLFELVGIFPGQRLLELVAPARRQHALPCSDAATQARNSREDFQPALSDSAEQSGKQKRIGL